MIYLEGEDLIMKETAFRLLLAAAALMLLAAVLFAIVRMWLYTGLLCAGALGCAAAALNFKHQKDT